MGVKIEGAEENESSHSLYQHLKAVGSMVIKKPGSSTRFLGASTLVASYWAIIQPGDEHTGT